MDSEYNLEVSTTKLEVESCYTGSTEGGRLLQQ